MGTVSSRVRGRGAAGRRRDPHRHAGARGHHCVEGAAAGVVLADGREVAARVVLGACDPFRLAGLVGADALPAELAARLDRIGRPGTTLKVNLALCGLPRFSCLPADAPSPFGSTIHLLPRRGPPRAAAGRGTAMWDEVQAGRLPEFPPSSGTSTPPSTRRCGPRRPPLVGAVRAVGALRHRRVDLGRRAGPVRRAPARRSATASPRAPPTWSPTRSRCRRPASRSTSASPAGTSTTSTTRSPSPTGCRTRPEYPASTPAAPAATRPVR